MSIKSIIFVMVELYKWSLCKWEFRLRSSSVDLKEQLQIKPDSVDAVNIVYLASVMSHCVWAMSITHRWQFYAFLHNSFFTLWGYLPPVTEFDAFV